MRNHIVAACSSSFQNSSRGESTTMSSQQQPAESSSSSGGWATPDDWVVHRALITSLYKEQNKTLKEVMRTMEEDHNFVASVKMYKTHIRKWAIDKNMKAKDAAEIIRQQKERAAQGKSSVVYVRGRRVDPSKMQQYLSRASSSVATQILYNAWEAADGGLTKTIAVRTPSPEPRDSPDTIPPRLEDPTDLKIPHECMHVLRKYASTNFETGTWRVDISRGGPDTGNSMAWFGHLNTARDLIKSDRTKEGFHLLGICLDQYKQHLLNPDADFWLVTYGAAVGLSDSSDKLGDIFIDFASKMASVVLPPGHPFVQVWSLLAILRTKGIREHGAAVIKSYIDTCENYFAPMNPVRIHGPTSMFYALCLLGLMPFHEMAELQQRGFSKANEIGYGKMSYTMREGALAYMRGEFEGSLNACKTVSDWLEKEPPGSWADLRHELHWTRFRIKTAHCGQDEVLEEAKYLADFCKEYFGLGHYNTAYTLPFLERYFQSVGNEEGAAIFRKEFESQWKLLCKKARYFQR